MHGAGLSKGNYLSAGQWDDEIVYNVCSTMTCTCMQQQGERVCELQTKLINLLQANVITGSPLSLFWWTMISYTWQASDDYGSLWDRCWKNVQCSHSQKRKDFTNLPVIYGVNGSVFGIQNYIIWWCQWIFMVEILIIIYPMSDMLISVLRAKCSLICGDKNIDETNKIVSRVCSPDWDEIATYYSRHVASYDLI